MGIDEPRQSAGSTPRGTRTRWGEPVCLGSDPSASYLQSRASSMAPPSCRRTESALCLRCRSAPSAGRLAVPARSRAWDLFTSSRSRCCFVSFLPPWGARDGTSGTCGMSLHKRPNRKRPACKTAPETSANSELRVRIGTRSQPGVPTRSPGLYSPEASCRIGRNYCRSRIGLVSFSSRRTGRASRS